MEETSGIQLAQTLRESGSRAKLIYITISRDYAIDGYKVQANDYLVKPIEKEMLDAAIGRILDRHDSVLVEFVQTATKNDAVVKLMKEEFKTIEVVRGGSVGIESISMMER